MAIEAECFTDTAGVDWWVGGPAEKPDHGDGLGQHRPMVGEGPDELVAGFSGWEHPLLSIGPSVGEHPMPSDAAPVVGHGLVNELVVAERGVVASASTNPLETFDGSDCLGSMVEHNVLASDQPTVVSGARQIQRVHVGHHRRPAGPLFTLRTAPQEGAAQRADPDGWPGPRVIVQDRGQRPGEVVSRFTDIAAKPGQRRIVQCHPGQRCQLGTVPDEDPAEQPQE